MTRRTALQVVAGIFGAGIVWYALSQVGLVLARHVRDFDPSAMALDLLIGAAVLLSAVAFLWPLSALAGGVAMTVWIVAARAAQMVVLCDVQDPSLACVFSYGAWDPQFVVLAFCWIAAGIAGLVRHRWGRPVRAERPDVP